MTTAILCLCLLVQPPQVPMPASTSISETTGGIKAEIQTSDGTPVPGVLIRIKHRDGRVWTAHTDEKGHFQAGGLPLGDYLIESRLVGFKGETWPIQIKAQAWLLGIPNSLVALRETGTKSLRFHGPGTYESAPALIQPQKRPELGKIPMH